MSFKQFSSAHGTPSKASSSGDKAEDAKGAPAADQPATQPTKTPDNATPAPKP